MKPILPETIRTIVEEDIVRKAIDGCAVQYPCIHDIFSGLIWRMAREPEAGHLISRHIPGIYLMKIAPDINRKNPGITTLYKYDANAVTIMAVRIIPPPKPILRKRRTS